MEKVILSEGVEQGAELEANIVRCFDRLSGPQADVFPTKDQKGCGVGTWYFSCQPENCSYSLLHPLGG